MPMWGHLGCLNASESSQSKLVGSIFVYIQRSIDNQYISCEFLKTLTKEKMMSDWIPFENATYLVDQAFLVAEDNTAALLE